MDVLSPHIARELGQIGGALLVVIGFFFVFLFAVLHLLARRMDRMGDRIARLVSEVNAAHAEELSKAFAMIQVLIDQHGRPGGAEWSRRLAEIVPAGNEPDLTSPPIRGGAPHMLIYRLALPPAPPDVAHRDLEVNVDVDAEDVFWVNPGGLPGQEEGFDCGEDCTIVPGDATEIGVPRDAVVTLALIAYDAQDNPVGDPVECTFTAGHQDTKPPADPAELGVFLLRED